MHAGLGGLSFLSLFDPVTHTPYPLDFFFSWTGGLLTALHHTLKKVARKASSPSADELGRTGVFRGAAEQVLSQGEAAELHTLCISFAAELEMVDQWPWACAVVIFSPFTGKHKPTLAFSVHESNLLDCRSCQQVLRCGGGALGRCSEWHQVELGVVTRRMPVESRKLGEKA